MKTRLAIYVDGEIVKKARELNLNLSRVCDKALREQVFTIQGRNPLVEEKEQLLRRLQEISNPIQEPYKEAEVIPETKTPVIVHYPSNPFTASVQPRFIRETEEDAQARKDKFEEAIEQEIKNWYGYVQQSLVGSATKREKFCRERARFFGMELPMYMERVVTPFNQRKLSGKGI